MTVRESVTTRSSRVTITTFSTTGPSTPFSNSLAVAHTSTGGDAIDTGADAVRDRIIGRLSKAGTEARSATDDILHGFSSNFNARDYFARSARYFGAAAG